MGYTSLLIFSIFNIRFCILDIHDVFGCEFGIGFKGEDVILYDPEATVEEYSLTLQWQQLVERPECVDRLIVVVDGEEVLNQENPTDYGTHEIELQRNVCENQNVEIVLENQKLFQNADKHEYTMTLESILSMSATLIPQDILPYSWIGARKIQLYPLKNLMIKDEFLECIQKLVVLDKDHDEDLATSESKDTIELDDACSLNNLDVIYYNGKMEELFRRQVTIQQSSFCFNSIPSARGIINL